MSFSTIVAASGCLFAPGSSIRTVYVWDTLLDVESNCAQAHAACVATLKEDHEIDGIVIQLPEGSGTTIGTLASMVRVALVGLLKVETGFTEEAIRTDIPTAAWRMRINEQVVYPLAFGPCYGPDSSRHTFGDDGTYIILQPASAFSRRHDRATGRISERARVGIRKRHEELGRPYDLRLTLSPFECHKVVKPLHRGSHPVAWW
ncbi:hypothetical protein ACFVY0_39255 [Streptomyces sp. NPDC058286]|uniref:hypothetical protein n=1 Tax=Streptomyces sp. NPDC058286 TaxID=3346422 RepID=UPI0036EB8B26